MRALTHARVAQALVSRGPSRPWSPSTSTSPATPRAPPRSTCWPRRRSSPAGPTRRRPGCSPAPWTCYVPPGVGGARPERADRPDAAGPERVVDAGLRRRGRPGRPPSCRGAGHPTGQPSRGAALAHRHLGVLVHQRRAGHLAWAHRPAPGPRLAGRPSTGSSRRWSRAPAGRSSSRATSTTPAPTRRAPWRASSPARPSSRSRRSGRSRTTRSPCRPSPWPAWRTLQGEPDEAYRWEATGASTRADHIGFPRGPLSLAFVKTYGAWIPVPRRPDRGRGPGRRGGPDRAGARLRATGRCSGRPTRRAPTRPRPRPGVPRAGRGDAARHGPGGLRRLQPGGARRARRRRTGTWTPPTTSSGRPCRCPEDGGGAAPAGPPAAAGGVHPRPGRRGPRRRLRDLDAAIEVATAQGAHVSRLRAAVALAELADSRPVDWREGSRRRGGGAAADPLHRGHRGRRRAAHVSGPRASSCSAAGWPAWSRRGS